MSTSVSSVPALVAAFFFGIVVNAASAALFLHVSGHGSSVFRDGQRLALTIFLSSAALWAISDFISIAIDKTATSSCQIGIIFSTLFDQFARFSIEQFLLWAVNKGAKTGPLQMTIQGLVGLRFILGTVFVGFSRPQYNPVCVPESSKLPLAVILVVLDAVLIVVLAVAAFTNGLVNEVRSGRSDSDRGRAVILVMAAFGIWTATSIAMLLGISGTTLLARTLLPSIGLLILVAILTACNGALTADPTQARQDLPSPGMRNITTSESASSDMSGYPPSRFEDIKRSEVRSMQAFERPRNAPQPGMLANATDISRSVMMSAALTAPTATMATTITGGQGTRRVDIRPQASKAKRGFFDLRGGPAAGKMVISNPILEANGDQNPLNKIATISLEEAAMGERERRINDLQRDSALIAKRPAPQPPTMSAEEALMRSVSLKRKEVPSTASQPPMPTSSTLEPVPIATTSSAQLSPGVEELRRRSPGQPPADQAQRLAQNRATIMSTATVTTMVSPTIPLPSPQKRMPEHLTQDEIEEKDLREEIERIDQLQQSVFNRQQPQKPAAPISAFAMPPRPTAFDSALRRPNIRPSRQLPDSPKMPSAEPAKTPLQRRPTNGLPGNPRATAARILQKEGAAGRQQTVLFMNDIVYNDPQIVQNIIDGANDNTKLNNRDSSLSMVHRPRPIPRWQEIDRAIFPAAPSPHGHRRSKSGGSIIGVRKSALLQSHPGSPTQLPPLPLPPTMNAMQAAYNAERPSNNRPLPNDTKSMTFDEKMTLLFPTPPGSATDHIAIRRRSSSVPDMPAVPRDYIPIALSGMQGDVMNSRMSVSTSRTGRTSVKTENIFDVDNFLPNTRFDPGEDLNVRPLMTAPNEAAGGRGAGGKRASSPLLPPPLRNSAITASTDVRTHDDATTNWGSVHSPVYAVPMPIPANRLVARATYINGGDQRAGVREERLDAELPLLPATTYSAQPRMPTRARDLSPPASISSRSASDEDEAESSRHNSQWHRRIGDDTLSFSERKDRTRSRKMPPPTPLLLRNAHPSTRNPVIVKAAQPSPLDSPERALAYIQAQLRKYEEPNLAGSAADETPTRRLALLDNLEKEMDMQAGHWQAMQHNLRHDSLSTMQTLTPSVDSRRQSVRNSTYSISGVLAQQQKAARRSYMDSGTLGVFTDKLMRRSNVAQQQFPNIVSEIGALGSPTPPDSDNEDADLDLRLHRQQSVASEIGYIAKFAAPPSPVAKNLQFAHHNELSSLLWNPKATDKQTMATTTLLWTPAPASMSHRSTVLFASIPQPSIKEAKSGKKSLASGPLPIESVALWSKDVSKLAVQKDSGCGLWTVVRSHDESRDKQFDSISEAGQSEQSEQSEDSEDSEKLSAADLQNQKIQELEQEMDAMEADYQRMSTSSQKAPRPTTQRPPRRSKRVTLLPDILESPKPLPDKNGSLGIFQFPWGERSDTVKVPIRGAPFAMPGTMTSGGSPMSTSLEIRAKQLEMDEYTSSFFDDYDDDDDDDEDYDGSDDLDEKELEEEASESDDGFDENTLWEIASLLKTEQVPSKLSLLPPPHPASDGSVVDDYMNDILSDNEIDQFERSIIDDDGIIMGLNLNNAIMEQEEKPESLESQLWSFEKKSHKKTASVGEPDEDTWMSYNTVSQAATLRSKPRKSIQPAQVETNQLWDQSTVSAIKEEPIKSPLAVSRSSLWAADKTVQSEELASKVEKATESKMWTARPLVEAAASTGATLFDLHAATTAKLAFAVTRTTDMEPIAIKMPAAPRLARSSPLEQLVSSSLWAPATQAVKSHMWVPRKNSVVPVPAATMLFDKDVAAAAKMAFAVTRTTDLEPAALAMPRKVRTIKTEPLATLKSTRLWSLAKRSGSGMWAPRPAVKAVARSTGLFDKEHAVATKLASALTRTTHLEPAALGVPRKVRTIKAAPLETLKSTSLWTSTKPRKPLMWVPRPVLKVTKHTGLFDKDAATAAKLAGAVTRTTSLAPAALKMTRKMRAPKQAHLEKLQSTSLWASTKRTEARGMWAPRPVMKAMTSKTQLFDRDAAAAAKMAAAVTRTTELEPAALKMPRTPRAPRTVPLEKLVSTSLWGAKSTPASRMWAPVPVPKVQAKGQLFDRDVAAVDKLRLPIRTTAMEPAAIIIIRVPRSLSRLPALQLESSSLWTIPATSTVSVNWIVAKDPKPTQEIDVTSAEASTGSKQKTWWQKMKAATGLAATEATATAPAESKMAASPLPRPIVSSHDWANALQEAVEASYPAVYSPRIRATAGEWKIAMESATARSYPFDSAQKHPAMALASSSSASSSPAANDVSKVHPVFFQSEEVAQQVPEQIKLVSAQISHDEAYGAHIAAMENQALARLQALEGVSRGVVLRY